MFGFSGSRVASSPEEARRPPSPSTTLRLFSFPASGSSSQMVPPMVGSGAGSGGAGNEEQETDDYVVGESNTPGAARFRRLKKSSAVTAPMAKLFLGIDGGAGSGDTAKTSMAVENPLFSASEFPPAYFVNEKAQYVSNTMGFLQPQPESGSSKFTNDLCPPLGVEQNVFQHAPVSSYNNYFHGDHQYVQATTSQGTNNYFHGDHQYVQATRSQETNNYFHGDHQYVQATTSQETNIFQVSQGLGINIPMVMSTRPSKRKTVPQELMYGSVAHGSIENNPISNPAFISPPVVHPFLAKSDEEFEDLAVLIRKPLSRSDVSNASRIVLPKKECEERLPRLEDSLGIELEVDDLLFLPKRRKFKYRYWPNHKSRMYVIENTGEFVRENGLQRGDLFTIYRNTKTGNFAVRGSKRIRETKPDTEVNQESNGLLQMADSSIKQLGETPEGKRYKSQNPTDRNRCSDHTFGSSSITETENFPRESFNNSREEPVGPSQSPRLRSDLDLDFLFDGLQP